MNNKIISILGCGWLGLPLAEHLAKKGFVVKGSTTSFEKYDILKLNGISPFRVMVSDTEIISDNLNEFLNSDILIINFPPKRRDNIETYHQAQFKQLIPELNKSSIKHVLFVSSTSVYPDLNREVFENETIMPVKPSGKALKFVEDLLTSQSNFVTTIIRLSGLIGYDRMPGRFLAGKTNVENGNAPINVIHQDDCIELITQIIQQNAWGEIYNASADYHPTRKEFYTLAATKIGLKIPIFKAENETNFKIINSDKIKKRLGYSFKYPNPLDLINDCI
jgi:nucleoside-diphosphate-sugar epimerase